MDSSYMSRRPELTRHEGAVSAPVTSTPFPLWRVLAGGHHLRTETIMAYCYSVRGAVDPKGLVDAIALLSTRHTILQARLVQVNGSLAYYLDVGLLQPEYRELQSGDDGHQETECARVTEEFVWQPFATGNPLARALIVKLSAQSYVVCLVVHHLIGDIASGRVLSRDLMALYEQVVSGARASLPTLPISYVDYLLSIDQWAKTDEARAQLQKVASSLSGAQPARLEPDCSSPSPCFTDDGQHEPLFRMPVEVTRMLEEIAKRGRITKSAVLLAVQALLVWLDHGQTDTTFRIITENRDDPSVMNLFGFLINAVMFRMSLDEEMTCREVLDTARRRWLETLEYAHVRFSDLPGVVNDSRILGESPLFNFVPDGQKSSISAQGNLSGVRWTRLAVAAPKLSSEEKQTVLPLRSQHVVYQVNVIEMSDGLAIYVRYGYSTYTKNRMVALARGVSTLIEMIHAHPEWSLVHLRNAVGRLV